MRADRLLSILLLLQVHRRMTARTLAERLEVSRRTVHRDMESLCAAGVPLYAERGANGGWVLEDGYRTDVTGLNEAEVQALFLATPPNLLADLGLQHASQAALTKILAALPAVSRRDAEFARQRIHVDGAGWQRAAEDVPHLPALQEAVWRELKLWIRYSDGERSVELVVDPLGLVAKGTVWYLVAAVEGEVRGWRASRVRDARVLEEPSARPGQFDLARYWEDASLDFSVRLLWYDAVLRLAPANLERLQAAGRYARLGQPGPMALDRRVEVEARFETERDAAEFVLGFGPDVEVIRPEGLRRRVQELARETLRLYRA